MIGYYILTQAGILTLLMTSSPLLLLMLPPTLLNARASSLSSEPRCKFPRYLQTRRNKHWMMNQSNAFATFEVDGGKIFARHGACVRSHDYSGQRQSALGAECTKLNYTRVCIEKRPGNKYLVRHVESSFDDKYVCLQFLRRGLSVVQVKMSLIQGEQFLAHLCDERYMNVGPWPWISEEYYRSAPVRCPFSGGYNLRLKYASPPPPRRHRYYGSQTYYGPSYYSRASADPRSEDCVDSTTAPIRMESDCVKGEGVVFNFKHRSCLPADTDMALRQRALCMATWRTGREVFAMLRADNNDRAFFCLRVTLGKQGEGRAPRDMLTKAEMENLKIDEVMLFLGWVCPTSSYADSASSSRSVTGSAVSPLNTPHLALALQGEQQVITEPCSDQLSLCHNHTSFCQQLHCMRTCGQCTASESMSESASAGLGPGPGPGLSKKATVVITSDRFSVRYAKQREWDRDSPDDQQGEASEESANGVTPHFLHHPHLHTQRHNFKQKCTFPQRIRGTWLRRLSDGHDEKIVITDSTFNHPRLGLLECVTFTPPGSTSAPLQRVLWTRYTNGCYPRFTCLHFNTPARSVMRYRLADMQLWPLLLSDDAICDQRHFMEPPDMYQPGDKYTMRSWEVVRRSGHIHKLACILPHYVPRVVSFLDNRGRSGCLVHGTYYLPRDIALTFFPLPTHRKTGRPGHFPSHHSRAETDDVDGKSRDVTYRKADVDHTKGGSGASRSHDGLERKKKIASDPKSDLHHEDRSPGLDDQSHSHNKGQWFPDDSLVQPKHHKPDDKKSLFESEEWDDENWYENKHPDSGEQETEDVYGWEKLPPRKSENNRYSNNYHYNVKSYSSSSSSFPDNSNDKNTNIRHLRSDSRHRSSDDNALNTDRQNGKQEKHNIPYHQKKKKKNPFDTNHRYSHRYRRSGGGGGGGGGSGHVTTTREQVSYQCLAVMTYVDSYKSLLTVTPSNPKEILCWLVVNATTLVIVRTSSCNSLTARQILASPASSALHSEHVHNILYLGRGERDCSAAFPADLARPEPVEFREGDGYSGASASLWFVSRVGLRVRFLAFCWWCVVWSGVGVWHRWL